MRRLRRPALVAALLVLAAACGSQPPAPPRSTPTLAPASVPVATPSPAAPSAASPDGSPATGGAAEDPGLLDVFPATVDGAQVGLEHQAFLDAASDPAFAEHVRRAAFGVAVSGTDLVSGVVAELQPGSFSDGFFRDWRDTYNTGACGQAGGVVGTAETTIKGRTVYIGTCAGGLRTYHAWLPERGAIVSAFAVGQGRLGEALMEGLRP